MNDLLFNFAYLFFVFKLRICALCSFPSRVELGVPLRGDCFHAVVGDDTGITQYGSFVVYEEPI